MKGRHHPAISLTIGIAVFLSGGGHGARALPLHEGISDAKISEARGVQDDQLYYQVGGATINAFNFNLSITLTDKVGFPMTVDGGLAVELTATYNSNFYNRRSHGHDGQGGLRVCPQAKEDFTIDYIYFPRENPLGPGWEFHLGRIYRRQGNGKLWTYVSPDGQEHPLRPVQNATDLYETMDGSRIRARKFPGDQGWEIYLPDGRILEMRHVVRGVSYMQPLVLVPEDPPPTGYHCSNDVQRACTPATLEQDCDPGQCAASSEPCFLDEECANPPSCLNATTCDVNVPPFSHDLDKIGYHTSRIRTRETRGYASPAAHVDITYHDAPFDYIIARVRDSHFADDPTRQREIVTTLNDFDELLPSYGHVTRVSFPSPPDENGQPRPRADFEFRYETDSLLGVDVDYLVRVDYPEGYAMTLDYYRTGIDGAWPQGFPPGQSGTPDYGGKLEEVVHPSGKKTVVTYGAFERKWRERSWDAARSTTNSWDCGCATTVSETRFVGVTTMEIFPDVDDPALSYLTSFDAHTILVAEHDDPEATCEPGCYSVSKYWDSVSSMVDPAGNRTEIQYDTSSNPFGDAAPREPADYATFGTATEERRYGGNSGFGTEPLETTTRVWTQIDSHSCFNVSWAEPTVETTIHLDDDPDTRVTTARSDWTCGIDEINGRPEACAWGRFETTTTSGNGIGDWEKIVTTDYAIDNMEADDLPCPAAVELQTSWLPDVVASEAIRMRVANGDPEVVSLTQYAFDTTTGRVTDEIVRLDPVDADPCDQTRPEVAPASGDLVIHYDYDEAGNVATDEISFGDPAADVYRWEYEYAFGARMRRRNAALAYNDYIAVVDPATSLLLERQYGAMSLGDPAAVVRRDVYDVLRRPMMEQAGSTQPWRYEYQTALLPDRIRLSAVRSYRGAGDDLVESLDHYDTAGRVFKNEKLNPDGARAYRHTRFDPAGRLEFVSEWTDRANDDPELAGKTTDYTHPTLDYEDPFDRPHRVTGPLGEVTRYDYFGTNESVTVEGIAGLDGSTIDSTTSYYKDGLGRLRIVDSPAGADAIYDYDPRGHLTRVNLVDAVHLDPALSDRYATSDPDGQVRSFAYDALGRRTDASHPENGRTQTLSWNALGARRESQDQMGRDRGYFHRTIFDTAGRPIRIERVLEDAGKAVEDETYEAGSPEWVLDGWRTTSAGDCLDEVAWYQGDGSCRYAESGILLASLTSPAIAIPDPEGAQLSFRYFRQVRDDVAVGTPRDELLVRVAREADYTAPGFDWGEADELFALDSTQISWSEWRRSPAIPLDDYAGDTIKLRILFDSVDINGTAESKGIGISEVSVERPATTILQQTVYDETFGLPGNKSRGQATTVETYGESTHVTALVETFLFRQPEGRLSEKRTSLDWNRDGNMAEFVEGYRYDTMGRMDSQVLPHLTNESVARELLYVYRHGALTGLSSIQGGTEQKIVPDSPATPGIFYNLAGGPQRIRYGNALETHVHPNAAYLPERIWVDRLGAGARSFDTGSYDYDGARNIRSIGDDLYRYDAVGRLVQAKVGSGDYAGGLYLDYSYDAYGNLTDRTTGHSFGSPEPQGLGPVGLDFRGRSYTNLATGAVDNRFHDPPFVHDANGNLIAGPGFTGVDDLRYVFSPENRLSLVREGSSGLVFQESLYDAGGDRWARVLSTDGGVGRVTLRDASGQVVAEYVEENEDDGLRLARQYVRADETLMATHQVCGPAPRLEWSGPLAPLSGLELIKTDYLTPVGDYTIVVKSENGAVNVLTRPPSLADHFQLTTDDLFAGNNAIFIQAQVDCGRTGYGIPVSVNLEVTPNCIAAAALSPSTSESNPGGGPAVTTIGLVSADPSCPPTIQYNAYSPPHGVEAPVLSSHSAGDESPGPAMTTDYVFTDHLGSTRFVADELGVEIASYKFYPFGSYADASGGSDLRVKFTGHERDERLGLDYMLARYYGSGLGRFLSVDPITVTDERRKDPQQLNLFAYALNGPINYRDRNGKDVDVGNRAVAGTLGLGGHSFMIVTPTGANVQRYANRIDPNSGTITFSGFPVEDPNTGNDVLMGFENDARDAGNAEQLIGVPAPQGTSMEQFEANIIEAFDSYQSNQTYAVLPGTGEFNSNSLTSGLLTAGGADQIPDRGDLDRFNPGWDTPVPLPDATADDPPQQQRTPRR